MGNGISSGFNGDLMMVGIFRDELVSDGIDLLAPGNLRVCC